MLLISHRTTEIYLIVPSKYYFSTLFGSFLSQLVSQVWHRIKDAWSNTGLALGNLNKYEDAMEAFDKAIEINPQDSDAWYNKRLALTKLNKYDEAMKTYDKAIEIHPQDPIALKGTEIWSQQIK